MRRIILLLLVLILQPLIVNAQDTLTVDELKSGAVGEGNQPYQFIVNIPLAGAYEITVAEAAAGLAPQFRVTTLDGALVTDAVNLTGAANVSKNADFPLPGQYVLSISSSIGASGGFVVRLRPGQQLPAPTSLSIGQTITGSVASGQVQRIALSADPLTRLTLSISGQVDSTLVDGAGITVGQLSSQLAGGSMTLPQGTATYVLSVTNTSQPTAVDFIVMLAPTDSLGTGPISTPSVIATPAATSRPLPVLPVTGACVIATREVVSVNVRSTPTTQADNRVSELSPYDIYPVVGRVSDSSWYEVMVGSVRGWVAASVTRTGGDCRNVPVTFVQPTATPDFETTVTPTARLAENNEVSTTFNYQRDVSQGFTGHISYPAGDRQDTISWVQTEVPANPPSNTQFRYTVRCTGFGVEYAEIVFSDGSTRACTDTPYNVIQYVTNTSRRSDSMTIRLTGGENAYVEWRVSFSWFFP